MSKVKWTNGVQAIYVIRFARLSTCTTVCNCTVPLSGDADGIVFEPEHHWKDYCDSTYVRLPERAEVHVAPISMLWSKAPK